MYSCLRRLFGIRGTGTLCAMSVFCLLLSFGRRCVAADNFLSFLVWNLVLAFIPWLISAILHVRRFAVRSVQLFLMLLWLLFFPNAPYILTDIIHLGKGKSFLLYYDLIILLAYSFTGLFYAFVSLHLIESILARDFHIKRPFIISVFELYLCAFGIYLGRFLRWNSWDIVLHGRTILSDIGIRVIRPVFYVDTWMFVFFFGTMLVLYYQRDRKSVV